jgi:hypothetical protein
MCGPADFGALHTSLTRLAALFAGGVATYAVSRLVSLCRRLRVKRRTQEEVRSHLLRALPVQVSGEHSNS